MQSCMGTTLESTKESKKKATIVKKIAKGPATSIVVKERVKAANG